MENGVRVIGEWVMGIGHYWALGIGLFAMPYSPNPYFLAVIPGFALAPAAGCGVAAPIRR